MTQEQKSTIEQYIPIGLFIISMAVTWGVFTQKISADGERINDISAQYTHMEAAVVQTQIDVAQIKTSVEFIQRQYK